MNGETRDLPHAVFALRMGDSCIKLAYRLGGGPTVYTVHLDAADRADAERAVNAINRAIGFPLFNEPDEPQPTAGDPAEKEGSHP